MQPDEAFQPVFSIVFLYYTFVKFNQANSETGIPVQQRGTPGELLAGGQNDPFN